MSSREISEHFKLQFTPSKSAENLLKNISTSNIYVHNSKISITEVKSFSAGQTDMNVVYQGRPLCIAVVTSLTQNGRKRAECIEEFSMPFYVRKVE